MKKLPTLEQIRAEKARRSLAEFVRQAWHVVEPATPLIWNWHIEAICQHLEAVTRGEIKRLIINIPPGHMKSLLVSVFWQAWEWIEHPEIRTLCASYAMDLAIRDSVRCRDLITSDWYKNNFAGIALCGTDWELKRDQNAKRFFENTQGGFRFSLSVGSQATGFRGDKIIVDDALNSIDQFSEVALHECIFWWDKVMSTRVNDPRTGAFVVMGQRLCEDDLPGTLLARGGYEALILPTEFDKSNRCVTYHVVEGKRNEFWRDPRTTEGELLFPDLFTPEVVAQLKKDLGSDGFASQHQQRPAPVEGSIFKDYWFADRYKKVPKFKEVFAVWDTALKAKEENDETACLVSGIAEDGNLYPLRLTHGRWETPEVANFLVSQATWLRNTYGQIYVGDYIEDKVSGTTLMQYVRRTNRELALIPITLANTDGDKVARAKGVTPMCEAGRVILPDVLVFSDSRRWVEDLLLQIKVFPKGKHDDIVDVFVYALCKLMGKFGQQKSKRGRRGGMT